MISQEAEANMAQAGITNDVPADELLEARTLPHPHRLEIFFLYREDVPAEFFGEFSALARDGGIDLQLESYPRSPFAGLEQYLPTAVVLYLTKSYFDGFLNEMGREHYHALKVALKKLRSTLDLVKVTVFGTPGKITTDATYSRVYSMVIDGGNGSQFKFLLRNDLSEDDQERELDLITDFVERYRTRSLDDGFLARFERARVIGNMLLMACNLDANQVVPVDLEPEVTDS